MKKVLLIGNSPLPNENTSSRPAAGLRTHQFLSVLKQNCIVQVLTIAMPECYDDKVDRSEIKHSDKYFEARVSKDDPGLKSFVQRVHDDFQPEVIVSVNTFPSYIACSIKSQAPLWADLNGWIMAEAQAQAAKIGNDDLLAHYFEMEKTIVQRADKISCVSERQQDALLGELAAFGRLNHRTFEYEFSAHIPNGTEMFENEKNAKDFPELFEGIEEGAFILAWIGGYNTWVDEETLFKGVEGAMKKHSNIYFVSTGGKIEGLDNHTFKHFRDMIIESKYEDRFKFLGWVETEQIPYIYKRAHVGLNVDRMCTETLTGARNRINEMMKFGLPVITTHGSEIASEVEGANAGILVESGNAKALTEAILESYQGGQTWSGMKYISEKCNYKTVMKPLTDWLKQAQCAPDRFSQVSFGSRAKAKSFWRYFRQNGAKKTLKKIWQRIF